MKDLSVGGNQPATFRELAEREHVKPDELITSIAHYACNGWAVIGEVVVDIAKRTDLTPLGLQSLELFARNGMEHQLAGGRANASPASRQREAQHYLVVATYATAQLNEIVAAN